MKQSARVKEDHFVISEEETLDGPNDIEKVGSFTRGVSRSGCKDYLFYNLIMVVVMLDSCPVGGFN